MKLSDYLAKNNISQSEFAERVECTQGRISQLIQGETPSFDLAARIVAETGGKVGFKDFSGSQKAAA